MNSSSADVLGLFDQANDGLCTRICGDMDAWLNGAPVPPLAEILARWGEQFEMYRTRWSRGLDSHDGGFLGNTTITTRDTFVERYGFAIPCAELLDALAELAPVVEIGAGTGYLTRLMRHRGITVHGCDRGGNHHPFKCAAWDIHQDIVAGKTAVRRYPDRTVFCSWPTLHQTWFRQALRAMRIGQRIVTILGDDCAEETARDYLDNCFVRERLIEIPAFPHINDIGHVYRKLRQRPHDHARICVRNIGGTAAGSRNRLEMSKAPALAQFARGDRHLNMWTVYDHPSDHLHGFIARRWQVMREATLTDDVLTAATLDELRAVLTDRGLVYLSRSPKDDPKIVEVWLGQM